MIRKLGRAESFFWRLSLSGSNNLVIAFELAADLSLDKAQQALAQLCLQHPILTAVVDGDGGSLVFAKGDPLVLRRQTLPPTPDDEAAFVAFLEAELADALNQPLEPLYRATVVKSAHDVPRRWLCLAANHAVADGRTMVAVATEWLVRMRSVQDDPQGLRQIAPPAEAFRPADNGRVHRCWQLMSYVCEQVSVALTRRRADFQAPPAWPQAAGVARFMRVELSREQTQRWTTAAQRAQVSVHHLICAALGHAVKRTSPLAASIGLLTPVDLWAQQPTRTARPLGLYACGMTIAVPVKHRIKLTAREVSRQMAAGLKKRRVWSGLTLLGWAGRLSRSTDALCRIANRGYWASVTVSNLGKLNIPDGLVKDAWFVAAFSAAPRSGIHLICFSLGGQLLSHLCFDDRVYGASTVAAVAQQFAASELNDDE